MSTLENLPSIPEFFAGKRVFVTGGLGFLGKVIVEKLLRSCSDIDRIYLLARAKKGKNVSERLSEVIDTPVFDNLRESSPEVLQQKIELVEGDISCDNLGMSEADQRMFCENVNVIINSAATVKLTEPLRVAVRTNLCSVREILKLARHAERLESVVHISTAFANWFELDVKEQFYLTKHDPQDILKMVETKTDEELAKLVPSLLGKHQNTYTYTKSLAEVFISQHSQGLPVTIVRPSVVLSSFKEPTPGWIDSYGGPTLLVTMSAKGLCRSLNSVGSSLIDVIPVDMVVNLAIAAAWKVALEQKQLIRSTSQLPVIYNSGSGSDNPLTFREFFQTNLKLSRMYPVENPLWYPEMRLHTSSFVWRLDCLCTQMIPAYLMDFGRLIKGKKTKLVAAQMMTIQNHNSVAFALTASVVYQSKNYHKLAGLMSESDLRDFDFDVRQINWQKYIESYYLGLQKYLWKEKSNDYEAGRKKIARLKAANYLVMASTAAATVFTLKAKL